MFLPLPCFATLSRSTTPRKPDSRANAGVISGKPIGLIESTSIAPSSMRYRVPTLTWGRVHIRTLQVISPRRTPSRSRFANTMKRSYKELLISPLNGVVAAVRLTRQFENPADVSKQLLPHTHTPLGLTQLGQLMARW